ncbi:MAG TPA: hypothetical protein VG733_12890, partial [Chthoniobacteraceae bacterium]|nr:hypothetical protein [Chthoniobacteraceae bacterium]
DQDVRYSAVRELTTRKLAPGDFAAIRDGYAKEKFPATFGFFYMVKFLQAHDDANLPDFCLAMAKLEIRIETEGRGIVKPTPFVTGPESEADVATLCLLGIFAKRDEKNADPRFVPAALEILNTDPNEGHREQALDYFSKLTGEPRAQGIAAGLENSERSIQIKAAQLAGGLKVAGVGKPLVALLASPSAAVRAAAREAAKKLALDVPAADPERPAPAALAHIADTLWQCGLDEDEVVAGCGPVPEKVSNVFPTAPPQSAMPAEIKVVIPRKGDPRNFSLILTDPWRMTKMDADSVKKRGAQFAAGFSRGGQPDSIHGGPIDATGPYLIAAAMKLGDTATAQAVYERLCDRFTTDDGILYEGLQGLGWSRILTALDLYTHAKDDEALKAFARVIQLENHVRPRSFLAGYVKLAHQVTTDIERRKKEAPAPAPEFATGVECEAYWHEKFPDKKARIEAMVAQLQNGVTSAGWDHTRGESSLNIALEDEGSDAVEPLLDCLVHNDWLTRDVQEDWDHGEPVRWVTGVRGGIIDLLDKMYHKRFVTIENQAGFSEGDPATLQKIAEAVRAARDAEVKSESGK